MGNNGLENSISQFLQERIDANDFPSAVYLIAEKGEIVLRGALGFAVVEPEKIETKIDTIYDLASLTKVLATGLLAALMVENRELNIEDSVASVIPAFQNPSKEKIRGRHLITHTSGLRSWLPFYLLENRNEPEQPRETVIRVAAANPVERPPGESVIYSDLNFLLLGIILEKIAKMDLSDLTRQRIIQPLGLHETGFTPPRRDTLKIAASELGNYYEKKTCQDQGYFKSFLDPRAYKRECEQGIDVMAYRWREYQIWSEVHDANARFLGGIAGHAGLFSNVEEIFKISLQFLPNYTTLLKPQTCPWFRTSFTRGMREDRSFAFQLASTVESTAGTGMSRESFGHLGFTGTSLWIDPVKERIFILLTNRTHHHPLPFVNINSVRRRFHDLAIDFLEKNRSN
jgi:CubicO group peptidase (beta-lactamase class C family)